MNENPLAVPQREKSGPKTFGKYGFQYHWGLFRVLGDHKENKAYALIIELHEDVIVCDSLDASSARFEFNQVKEIESPRFTVQNLTKQKKGKASVLGKLIKSVTEKPFSSRIDTINLVASCGFALELKDKGLDLEVIRVGDLSEKCKKEIEEALFEETGTSTISKDLRFVLPKLHPKGHQDLVIAKIAEVVDHLFPESRCNSINIYRALIDELHRKGEVSFDYMKWDELMSNKALTSEKVARTIQVHTSATTPALIIQDCEALTTELGLGFLERKDTRERVERYYMEWIGFPSSKMTNIRREIQQKFHALRAGGRSDSAGIFHELYSGLADKEREALGDELDARAAVIFAMILSDV